MTINETEKNSETSDIQFYLESQNKDGWHLTLLPKYKNHKEDIITWNEFDELLNGDRYDGKLQETLSRLDVENFDDLYTVFWNHYITTMNNLENLRDRIPKWITTIVVVTGALTFYLKEGLAFCLAENSIIMFIIFVILNALTLCFLLLCWYYLFQAERVESHKTVTNFYELLNLIHKNNVKNKSKSTSSVSNDTESCNDSINLFYKVYLTQLSYTDFQLRELHKSRMVSFLTAQKLFVRALFTFVISVGLLLGCNVCKTFITISHPVVEQSDVSGEPVQIDL